MSGRKLRGSWAQGPPSYLPSNLSTDGWEGPISEGFLQEAAHRGAEAWQ